MVLAIWCSVNPRSSLSTLLSKKGVAQKYTEQDKIQNSRIFYSLETEVFRGKGIQFITQKSPQKTPPGRTARRCLFLWGKINKVQMMASHTIKMLSNYFRSNSSWGKSGLPVSYITVLSFLLQFIALSSSINASIKAVPCSLEWISLPR